MLRKVFSTDEHGYNAYIKSFSSNHYVASLICLTKHSCELFYNDTEEKILNDIRNHIISTDGDIKYESSFFGTY